MERGKAISLSNLARSHSEEIDQMLLGITGSASSTLWTAAMRPATRGGKCTMVGASVEEPTATS